MELNEDGHISLTNFGYSKIGVVGDRDANSYFMSITRVPPEILESRGHGKAVDWYMAGGFLFEMLTGTSAFFHKNKDIMSDSIK